MSSGKSNIFSMDDLIANTPKDENFYPCGNVGYIIQKEKTYKPVKILRLMEDNEIIQEETDIKRTDNVLGGNSITDARKARLLYYGKI